MVVPFSLASPPDPFNCANFSSGFLLQRHSRRGTAPPLSDPSQRVAASKPPTASATTSPQIPQSLNRRPHGNCVNQMYQSGRTDSKTNTSATA